MITLFQSNTICPLSQIKGQMAGHIKQLPAKVGNGRDRSVHIGDCPKIIRHELHCEPLDTLTWLHNQNANTKIYWSDRGQHFEIGGIGITDGIKGNSAINYKELFTYMEDRLSADNPHLRYYGGMNFDDSSCDAQWQEFGTHQFVIPQFEIVHSNGQTTFAFNMAINKIDKDSIETVLSDLDQIDFAVQTAYRKVPQVLARSDFPDQTQWRTIFSNVCDAGNTMKHQKIVLARKSVFDFDVILRSDALLKHLKDITPHCYHFCFQFSKHTAFLGATPERLYRRDNKKIESEAIAGTRPRGKDEKQDLALENLLRNSPKDALEHQYVVGAISEALKPLCRSLKSEGTFRLRKLKGSQHLVTCFEGELESDISDQQILTALHPTPAVAGCPTDSAMDSIKQLEPFSRGWYAGPIGYIGHDHAQFAVAIRCGLVSGNQLSLYAGAGIVSGSTAQGEWDEIENKIGNFISVFSRERTPFGEPSVGAFPT